MKKNAYVRIKTLFLLLMMCLLFTPHPAWSNFKNDLLGMITNYEAWNKGLPAGDMNRGHIGNREVNQRLVFS